MSNVQYIKRSLPSQDSSQSLAKKPRTESSDDLDELKRKRAQLLKELENVEEAISQHPNNTSQNVGQSLSHPSPIPASQSQSNQNLLADDHAVLQRAPQDNTPSSQTHAPLRNPSKAKSVEHGHVYFWYRPKVDISQVKSLDDVQKFYILLKTNTSVGINSSGTTIKTPYYRIIRVGKKMLPSMKLRNKFWSVVEESTHDLEKIDTILSTGQYSTITRGERTLSACRMVGAGVYSIIQTETYTHLAYVLETQNKGEVQHAFNIEHEGSFILSMKNPKQNNRTSSLNTSVTFNTENQETSQPGLPLNSDIRVDVELPAELQAVFRGRGFAPAIPIDLLNHKGMELILISESSNLVQEFGNAGAEIEEIEQIEEIEFKDQDHFDELRIRRDEHPIEPLLYGTWK